MFFIMQRTKSLWRQWLTLWMWGFIVYSALIVMSAIQNEVAAATAGRHATWLDLFGETAIGHYGYALFVPPLFLLVRRFPLDRAHWKSSAPILLAASFIFTFFRWVILNPIESRLLHISGGFARDVLGPMYSLWTIVAVSQAFEFYRRAQDRERQAAELRERLTQSRLDALRSQLHPHFLFNTLNGAASLMHTDVAGADRMLTQLSDLLRSTLNNTAAHEIPLGEELELLQRYLDIMQVRFHDRLTVEVDAPLEARSALVPAFLLQPLVENALEHGIAARPGPGTVRVQAVRDDGWLTITVTDDGPGPGADMIAGIGIANTRDRLTELYGDAQELTLGVVDARGGGEVRVTLPWHTARRNGG
jgi:two-component system, LytTR family, sensor kinase